MGLRVVLSAVRLCFIIYKQILNCSSVAKTFGIFVLYCQQVFQLKNLYQGKVKSVTISFVLAILRALYYSRKHKGDGRGWVRKQKSQHSSFL